MIFCWISDEGIYEYVDDHAYLEPSPAYWHESRGFQPRYSRVTLPSYRRYQQAYEVTSRRTLPRGTLLLVDDDHHVTGCDVTRSIMAFDRQGSVFYVPRSSVRRFDDSSAQPWLFPVPLSSHQATVYVAGPRQNGCFVVYRPCLEERSTKGHPEYVLAVGLSQGETWGQIQTVSCSNIMSSVF